MVECEVIMDDEVNVEQHAMHSGQRTAVLVLMILFFLCANLVGPWLFWDVYGWNFVQYAALFATGGLAAEVCLLAIWSALGAQSVVFRVPLTGSLVLVAGCAYVIGLRFPGDDLPLDVGIFMIAAGLLMYGCIQVPLWVLRVVTQQRIDVPEETDGASSAGAPVQFTVRDLLIGTAVVGMLLVLVKHSLPEGHLSTHARWFVVVGTGLVFVAFSAAICLPCIWLTLRDNPNRSWALGLSIVVLGGPPVVFAALVAISAGGPDVAEVIMGIYVFGLGTAATLILVLLIVRAIGYRLICPAAKLVERPDSDAPDIQTIDG